MADALDGEQQSIAPRKGLWPAQREESLCVDRHDAACVCSAVRVVHHYGEGPVQRVVAEALDAAAELVFDVVRPAKSERL